MYAIVLLPRLVIIVLDGDILQAIDEGEKADPFGVSITLGNLLHWLCSEFRKISEVHKDCLPARAKRFRNPQFLWIAPPQHISLGAKLNLLRRKIVKALIPIVQLYNNMEVVWLKKIWDYNDLSLMSKKKFSAKGLEAYWTSLDNAVQYWESKPICGKFQKFGSGRKRRFDKNDKYHWKRGKPNMSGTDIDGDRRFVLPTPPSKAEE